MLMAFWKLITFTSLSVYESFPVYAIILIEYAIKTKKEIKMERLKIFNTAPKYFNFCMS